MQEMKEFRLTKSLVWTYTFGWVPLSSCLVCLAGYTGGNRKMYLENVERRNLKSSPLSNRKENARRDLYKTQLFFYRQHDYVPGFSNCSFAFPNTLFSSSRENKNSLSRRKFISVVLSYIKLLKTFKNF